MLLTYDKTTGVTSGNTYKFRYRAENLYGWGDYSAELTLIAATVPT